MTAFTAFCLEVQAQKPRIALVLGSGLALAVNRFTPTATIDFGDFPGLVPPTVAGHPGRLAIGTWDRQPVLVAFGRIHFYEGHPWDRVTRIVRFAAEFEVRHLILTNAAGGIRPNLGPGSLMPIRNHLKWLTSDGWKARPDRSSPYSQRLLDCMTQLDRSLTPGNYAALTGPCYETPAEIRALRALGADAVGMSTAMEAETAAGLGLEVVAVSCITNKAAGVSDQPLSHAEVKANAQLAVGRLGKLIGELMTTIG